MKISKKWLQEYVFLPDSLSAQDLGHELTLRTVEVEGIVEQGKALENIVVATIKSVEPHPNADKLRVCQVDAGSEIVQIVCGGSNLVVGMKVVLAKIGASVLWHGEGEPVVLEKASLRGVDSYGMICGAEEVGLSTLFPPTQEKEIVDLSHLKVKSGTPLAKALGLDDVTFEVDNKSLSNRPDLWGHLGMAREIATIYHKKLTLPKFVDIKSSQEKKLLVQVDDTLLCPRYMAVTVTGITVAPSPEWLQKRLESCGIRPINNIVDITNFVMLELGQPTHAFDADTISENTLIIRHAKDQEEFVTLDEKKHTLKSDMLMICDKEKPLALAGIMGGQESGIRDTTKTIIFESATFEPSSIRKTSTYLGLRTDASARFEKSLDPVNAELALKRLVALTLEICPGAKVASPVVDVYPQKFETKIIETSFSFLEQKIGLVLDHKKVIDILERLGFHVVKGKKGILKITVPTWRATKDIALPEDIVEEVVRILGYEVIPTTLPFFTIVPPRENKLKNVERALKEYLAFECGYTETYNYSFESPELLKKMGVDTSLHLELENPIAKDRPLIRRGLIPNMLENVEGNMHRFSEIKLFETGRTYKIEEAGERIESQSNQLLPRQDTSLGIVYSNKSDDTPFYEVSRVVSQLFKRLHQNIELKKNSLGEAENSWIHGGRFASLYLGENKIGYLSELHPQVAKTLGLDARVALCEINLNSVAASLKESISYQPLSNYPQVLRDIAFVVDTTVQHSEIVEALSGVDPLIQHVELFDVYQGQKVSGEKKSVAYHITYGSPERTLTTEEVDMLHKKVLEILNNQFGAEIRK